MGSVRVGAAVPGGRPNAEPGDGRASGAAGAAIVSESVSIHHAKGPSHDRKGPLTLVAGAGFEPATSGL